jgi:hypothetical protein
MVPQTTPNEITERFKIHFPLFADKIVRIYPENIGMFLYKDGMTVAEAFKIALRKDERIDSYEIPALVTIPAWLEHHCIRDIFSDTERRAFKVEFLTKEENLPLSDYLKSNKLRISLLENINMFFTDKDIGYPFLIVDHDHRSRWNVLMQRIKKDKETLRSVYGNYDFEARLHYIDEVSILLRAICIRYIES